MVLTKRPLRHALTDSYGTWCFPYGTLFSLKTSPLRICAAHLRSAFSAAPLRSLISHATVTPWGPWAEFWRLRCGSLTETLRKSYGAQLRKNAGGQIPISRDNLISAAPFLHGSPSAAAHFAWKSELCSPITLLRKSSGLLPDCRVSLTELHARHLF